MSQKGHEAEFQQYSPIPLSWACHLRITLCPANDEHKPCSEAGKSQSCIISPFQLIPVDLITAVKSLKPLFAPNAKSTYSNIAFELLGLVLAKVTGRLYEEYIASSVLGPIGMNATTFMPPVDSVAVLPKVTLPFHFLV